MAKKTKAFFTISFSCSIRFHTNPAETPIITYSILQTGAKIQLGGLKLGLTNVGYQVVIADRVTIPEKYPITKHVTTTTRILEILFIL